MTLREITEHTRSLRQGMDIVFEMMIQRHVTLGQLVQVLKEMKRFDAIGLLTEAGYRDDNALGRWNSYTGFKSGLPVCYVQEGLTETVMIIIVSAVPGSG